jgi:hypothetical protein
LSRQRSTLFGHYMRTLEAKDFKEGLRVLEKPIRTGPQADPMRRLVVRFN